MSFSNAGEHNNCLQRSNMVGFDRVASLIKNILTKKLTILVHNKQIY